MFNEGDVVILKSGGPRMTVTGVVRQDNDLRLLISQGYAEGDVTVEWFDGMKLERGTFRQTSVELD